MRRGLRATAALGAAAAGLVVSYAGVGGLAPASACAQGPVPTPTIPTIGPLDPTCSRVPDTDRDGVLDVDDNCHRLFNPTQVDTDQDAGDPPYEPVPVTFRDPKTGGDACDVDDDGDDITDIRDNCPKNANRDQKDSDADGAGDPCDATPLLPGGQGGAVPKLKLGAFARTYRADELRAGLAVPVRCTAACALSGVLRARKTILGRGAGGLTGAGSTFVFVRIGKAGRRKIARSRRTVATVSVQASDDVGHKMKRSRRVTVRR